MHICKFVWQGGSTVSNFTEWQDHAKPLERRDRTKEPRAKILSGFQRIKKPQDVILSIPLSLKP